MLVVTKTFVLEVAFIDSKSEQIFALEDLDESNIENTPAVENVKIGGRVSVYEEIAGMSFIFMMI